MDRLEPPLILGTAGHIDHGKTALCRALTGVDTDRLPEEKQRGITIELGFAPLDLPDATRLGVVDVPGHEALVRTMVAGATGIDLLLLVVAADEGVMPQTREHLAICELLGITRAVVALTKVDQTDAAMAGLAADEVRELLAPTPLADAPILRVSAHTGEGIDALRTALAELAAGSEARTPRRGPPRLPVDRCFEMRGFGPVVTGTLVGSELRVGDAVEFLPGALRAKVRGLQCHGEQVERVEPGMRCAVNLQGIALDALSRGQVLCAPGRVEASSRFDAELHWLSAELREASAVSLLAGTAECLARVAPISAPIAEGGRGFARVHLDGDPIALLPGDRFVVRGFARGLLGATLGGGVVLDAHPPHRRRSDPALRRELERLASREIAEEIGVRIERAGLSGLPLDLLARQTGLERERVDSAIAAAGEAGRIARAGECAFDAAALERIEALFLERVAAYHAEEPLHPGIPAAALRGHLPDNVPPEGVEFALERLIAAGRLRRTKDALHLPEHRARLDEATQRARDRLLATLERAGLEVPSLRDLATQAGLPVGEARNLLAHLEREGAVVRAPGELWFGAEAVEALRARVREHFAADDEIDTRAYKALIGTTRRTAVPLMELFDDEQLTLRRGERRRLHPRARS